jgi:hypothetical protein
MEIRTGIRTDELLRSLEVKNNISYRALRAIISSLKKSSNFWRIVELSEQPLTQVAEVLKALLAEGYLRVNGEEILFTHKVSELDWDDIGDFEELKCNRCNGRSLELRNFSDLLQQFKEIAKGRPQALREYDQGFISEENTIARVALMHRKGDVKGRDIMVIGDDDLLSIALWLTGLPARITVLEIDERLTSFIKKITKGEVEVIEYDVRQKLPQELIGTFDNFFTDPTESLQGFKLFVLRGILSLRDEGAGYFGLTKVEASSGKWYRIQGFIHDCGFVITDIIDDFNHYQDWEYYKDTKAYRIAPVKSVPTPFWYKSSQIRIEKTMKKSLENIELNEFIYLDDESSTV